MIRASKIRSIEILSEGLISVRLKGFPGVKLQTRQNPSEWNSGYGLLREYNFTGNLLLIPFAKMWMKRHGDEVRTGVEMSLRYQFALDNLEYTEIDWTQNPPAVISPAP